MNLIFDGTNFHRIQQELGERPGGYRVDPYYLRHGIGNQPYFWNGRKWVRIKLGDSFYMEDGIPRKTGTN